VGRRPPLTAYLAHAERGGFQWTPFREAALRMMWSTARPLGAYEAAERMTRRGHPARPASMYRAFRWLIGSGLMLPIVTWKRFLLSPDPSIGQWALLLCRGCRSCTAVEMAAGGERLERQITGRGFAPRMILAECEGLCARCAGQKALATDHE
jgi:Fur family zinc uptake transcriptional regulator